MRVEPLDFEIHWRRSHPFVWARRRDGAINPNVCFFGTSSHTTTETKNTDPWAPQQPYLTQGFGMAQNLANSPAPQQQNPVAPFNDAENSALQGIISRVMGGGSPITSAGTGFGADLLSGNYFGANPGNGYFSSLAGTNLGLSGPGSSTLSSFANGGGAGSGTLSDFAKGKGIGSGTFSDFANGGGVSSDTLKKYADGGYFSNGYSGDVAQNVMAEVVPQISAIFNRGNSVNNPALARSAASGVTSALAPLEYQNYQTQEQLQQQAADRLRTDALAGAGQLGSSALSGATQLGTQALTGASAANSGAIQGAGVQATGASGLSGNFQDTLAKMVQGLALAPSTQGLSYGDMSQLFNAGQAQQSQAQNEAGGQAASYNFSQMSPYQQLAAYMQAVTGNYGGQSTDTKPYYTNDTANTLGTVSGIASTAAMILPFL